MMKFLPWFVLCAALLPRAFPSDKGTGYLDFIRAKAAELRQRDQPPKTIPEWEQRKGVLRKNLLSAWGGFPWKRGPVQARKLGEFQREGYRVERIIFETFPGVWMSANAYVPERAGRAPALLMVHGHWRGAKQDPVVQARCIGAAKLGFFVLVVDAFGAGERGVGRALGEYHGDMTAATLLPVGWPLSGLQVYENMCAVDYLRSRPEVDPQHVGITGASGGGNQSMYAGAWDERLSAVVPVCSVGNYQAYLGAACCMCEVVPGALRFTEESGILGMVAPRALMVINATRDARQFSVEEARKSLAYAGAVFGTLGAASKLNHVTFESGHDYSQPMREAVYGWMKLHLQNEGTGSPVTEPAVQTEDPESLRCFPGNSRPDDWMTIPKFAAAEGRRLQRERQTKENQATSNERWQAEKARRKRTLEELLGGLPARTDLNVEIQRESNGRTISYSPEPRIRLTAKQAGDAASTRTVVIVDLNGSSEAAARPVVKQAVNAGWSVITLSLRATGELAWPTDKIGRAPDHTTAQWGLWIGRPLLGQWVIDISRLLDALQKADGKLPNDVALAGFGPGGIVALAASAFDERITRVALVETLATFVTDSPYEEQRLGTIVPGILREFGDIGDMAALVAPRPLLISGGVLGDDKPIEGAALKEYYRPAEKAYGLLAAGGNLTVGEAGLEGLFQPAPKR